MEMENNFAACSRQSPRTEPSGFGKTADKLIERGYNTGLVIDGIVYDIFSDTAWRQTR